MSTVQTNKGKLEAGELFTEMERGIIKLVEKACDSLKPEVIIARIVGGWVRDKLLGLESDDVDIAVEGTDGVSFAKQMEKVALKEEFPHISVHTNPEQSAHLATAKVYINKDFYIDVGGLRYDEYTDDSRIPIIHVGTPLQDAQRRDFTVNCLFYNINTKKVEDFTDGLPDLEDKILRTPVPAKASFLEDPLRINRAFRFGTRFHLRLHPEILEAAKNARSEYEAKITAERALQELTKTLEGPDPAQMLEWASEAGLFDAMFDPEKRWTIDAAAAAKRVRTVLSHYSGKENRLELVLAAIYSPLFTLERVPDPGRKKAFLSPVEYVLLRELKLTLEVARAVMVLLGGCATVEAMSGTPSRVTAGRFVMAAGPLFSAVGFLLEGTSKAFFDDVLAPFITSEGLERAFEMKPLLRGGDLAKAHGVKPGPGLKDLTERLIDWQLEHPKGTAEDYIASIN